VASDIKSFVVSLFPLPLRTLGYWLLMVNMFTSCQLVILKVEELLGPERPQAYISVA